VLIFDAVVLFFFFFQAEDGIRDKLVTGVQTCALPIFGGSEALGEPYLTIRFSRMLKKRAGWLSALFLGEMLTATAMGFFEKEIRSEERRVGKECRYRWWQ